MIIDFIGSEQRGMYFDAPSDQGYNVQQEQVQRQIADSLSRFGITNGDNILVADPQFAEEIITTYESTGIIKPPKHIEVTSFKEVGRISSSGNGWPGTVSLAEKLDSGEVNPGEVQQAAALIPRLYVSSSGGAAIRCPDPRILAEFDGFKLEGITNPLGPQVIGGTVGAAISSRLATGLIRPNNSLSSDVADLEKKESETGFQMGDHTHTDAPEGEMGCKGVDDALRILQILGDSESIEDIDGLTKLILGNRTFDPLTMNGLRGAADRLFRFKDDYFTRQAEIVEQLKATGHNSLQVLTGPNEAAFVVVNFVPGTTFHKDLYNFLTGNKIQVINYDFWRSIELAQALAINNHDEVEEAKLRQFLHARVAYTVATLKTMLDGSQFIYTRVPNDFELARGL